jgi:hypothetical protein
MSANAAPQHMQALAIANRMRLEQAALKRRIEEGDLSVISVLADPPLAAQRMRIESLLTAPDRIGVAKANRVLREAGPISPMRKVGQLTLRQRHRLIEVFEERCPCVARRQREIAEGGG